MSCFKCNTKEAIAVPGHSARFDVSIYTMTRSFFNRIHSGVARRLHNNFGFTQIAIKCMTCKFVLITDLPKKPKNSNISVSLTSHTIKIPKMYFSTWGLLDVDGIITKGLSGRMNLLDTKSLCITNNPNIGYEANIPLYQKDNIGVFVRGETVDIPQNGNLVPYFCKQFSDYFKFGVGTKSSFKQRDFINNEKKGTKEKKQKVYYTKEVDKLKINSVVPKSQVNTISDNPLMREDDYILEKSVTNSKREIFRPLQGEASNPIYLGFKTKIEKSKFNYKDSMKNYMKRKKIVHNATNQRVVKTKT